LITDSLNDLAVFGGKPAFEEKLHVGRPNIGDRVRLLQRINDILDTRWLSNMGPYEKEFERRICDLTGVRNCIAMCNATVALEIAIRACDLTGEVIIPSFTFIATAHALRWQQITPVFCDVDPETHNLDPTKIEELITEKTTGILPVHLWGRACDTEAIEEIARRHNLTIVYDAAHAFGCSYKGRMIGGFGRAEVFSFHPTKFINSFEGGAIVTNDDNLAAKLRLMKNFGFAGIDKVSYIGTNGKMNEASAAMGLTSLESLDEFVATNRANYYQYRERLSSIPGLRPASYDEREKCNYQYIVVELEEAETGINRNDLIQVLWAENVLARRYFYPGCHRAEPYRSDFLQGGPLLPETEKLATRVMTLPTGSAVGEAEIEKICQIIDFAVAHGKEIHERLGSEVFQPESSPRTRTIASPAV
jgi:dTDP-4-amino-4,6-dideoxygalactose transaminase